MWKMYYLTQKEIENGDYSRMADLHIISSGLKALTTTDSSFGIERLRLACGGHGYLTSTNFNTMYGDTVAAYTYEGENTVLLLQVGRYLVKTWLQLLQGKQMSPLAAYLAEMYGKHAMPPWNDSWEYMVKLLQFTATKSVI